MCAVYNVQFMAKAHLMYVFDNTLLRACDALLASSVEKLYEHNYRHVNH
jgi:hypothetical protein